VRARLAAATLACLACVGAGATSASAATSATASARSLAIRVVLPDGTDQVLGEAKAPPPRLVTSGGLTWGEGVVVTGAVWARARAAGGARAKAWAAATLRNVSLFGGEVTVGAVSMKATASASQTSAGGDLAGSWLAEITVLDQAVRAAPNARVELGDWGYAVLFEQAVVREAAPRLGRRTSVTALHVHLTADHGGLPAGTEVLVGHAEAGAVAVRTPKSPPVKANDGPPKSGPPKGSVPLAAPKGPKRDPEPSLPGAKKKPPPIVEDPPERVKPKLTTDGYVFPVYGPASFTDDFAAARAITGWHHGNDVFAPVGAPILAVTDGTLFLVGWNEVGGNRLWLRDDQGNEFYYAHLSAFSPLAFEGSRVEAGDVIGFVGATGDAAGTPSHLHFEIHPAALLGLGYDGVINPYPYLLAWHRVADATFDWGAVTPGKAPPPGLVLLQADDIASTSGLDANALAELMALPALFGETPAAGGAALVEESAG
jgi:murein DD-endopeptidase MepM/ murein hydrolase activator NlpD